jgi:hypothetical protein
LLFPISEILDAMGLRLDYQEKILFQISMHAEPNLYTSESKKNGARQLLYLSLISPPTSITLVRDRKN